MIFVIVGTQKFQLNRLLKEIDKYCANNEGEEVFAQIGCSDYIPKNFKYERFLNDEEFKKKIEACSLVICHCGVGSITTAMKFAKPILVYPRLRKFNEHIDDHQMDIARAFERKKSVICCYENDNLPKKIQEAQKYNFEKNISSGKEIIKEIIDLLVKLGFVSLKEEVSHNPEPE